MSSSLTRRLAWGASIVTIVLLGYILFPGHTYLQSDTQIYVPMLERLRDPALFTRDISLQRTHLTYTAYDEAAVALSRLTGLGFEGVLTVQQLLFRALAVTGLVLIALRLGLDAVEAWFVAAVVSLGATIAGPAVLTMEYEPVPRGFAVALLVFAVGLAMQERHTLAGIAGAAAFLYHAPTTLPFWIVAGVLALRRRTDWKIFLPLAPAILLLMLLAHLQPKSVESAPVFSRLEPFDEWLQKMRAGYSYVSTWRARFFWDYGFEALIVGLAAWRLRGIGGFLTGLPIVGLLSMPVSLALLEWQKWALIPQWQPARAVLFVTLIAALLAAIAGVRAARNRRWVEAAVWLTVAFLISMKHAMLGTTLNLAPLRPAVVLALLATAGVWLNPRSRGLTLAVAGFIPFFAIPASKVVRNYPRIETAGLVQLSDWARANTAVNSVFLFTDAGTDLDPGIFRAHAMRALYVDWKSGGQVNYFPGFTREWWKRWTDTGGGHWNVTTENFPRLAELSVDYVVVHLDHAIPGRKPDFSNAVYVVYATSYRDSPRSGWRNNSPPSLRSARPHSTPPSATGPCD
jgi:hypothetical protein